MIGFVLFCLMEFIMELSSLACFNSHVEEVACPLASILRHDLIASPYHPTLQGFPHFPSVLVLYSPVFSSLKIACLTAKIRSVDTWGCLIGHVCGISDRYIKS